MNYEEKYKEALKSMRDLYNKMKYLSSTDALAITVTLENTFPELKESEDEKIRKAIVKMISDIDGGYPFEKYGIIKKKALAWLEKQGEQKSTPKYKIGDCIEYRGEKYKITNVTVTDNNFYYDVSLIGAPSDAEEVVTAIGFAAEQDIVKIEQPSWSEEDDIRLNQLIEFIQKFGFKYYASTDKVINWLKSLRPQSHWKPSEEQMEAIKFCCANFEEYDALQSLYNDLKKL